MVTPACPTQHMTASSGLVSVAKGTVRCCQHKRLATECLSESYDALDRQVMLDVPYKAPAFPLVRFYCQSRHVEAMCAGSRLSPPPRVNRHINTDRKAL